MSPPFGDSKTLPPPRTPTSVLGWRRPWVSPPHPPVQGCPNDRHARCPRPSVGTDSAAAEQAFGNPCAGSDPAACPRAGRSSRPCPAITRRSRCSKDAFPSSSYQAATSAIVAAPPRCARSLSARTIRRCTIAICTGQLGGRRGRHTPDLLSRSNEELLAHQAQLIISANTSTVTT